MFTVASPLVEDSQLDLGILPEDYVQLHTRLIFCRPLLKLHISAIFNMRRRRGMLEASQYTEPEVVGEQHGGKWIAWDGENLHIIASGVTAAQAKQDAMAAGVSDPTLEFVPPSDAAFTGGL
jgi:hypothetical protein